MLSSLPADFCNHVHGFEEVFWKELKPKCLNLTMKYLLKITEELDIDDRRCDWQCRQNCKSA